MKKPYTHNFLVKDGETRDLEDGKRVEIYIDGVKMNSKQYKMFTLVLHDEPPKQSGEYMIWNRVLTEAEVESLYKAGNPEDYPFQTPKKETELENHDGEYKRRLNFNNRDMKKNVKEKIVTVDLVDLSVDEFSTIKRALNMLQYEDIKRGRLYGRSEESKEAQRLLQILEDK